MPIEDVEKIIRKEPLENHYEVGSELGRGKYAIVKRCTCKQTGEQFAAKVLKKRRRGKSCREEILVEIDIMRQGMDHARIVKLHQVYESASEFHIIIELATGGELFRVIAIDPLPEEKAREVVYQIVDGVQHLHALNIVHLDLKPENILLYRKGSLDIKIADFGLSVQLKEGQKMRNLVGTAEYVAPEILNFEPLSCFSDMWSIGALTYALITGYSPFQGETHQQTFLNVSTVDYDFDDELFDNVSQEAKEFIEKLLIKQPAKRMTAEMCMQHPWMNARKSNNLNSSTSSLDSALCMDSPSSDLSPISSTSSSFGPPPSTAPRSTASTNSASLSQPEDMRKVNEKLTQISTLATERLVAETPVKGRLEDGSKEDEFSPSASKKVETRTELESLPEKTALKGTEATDGKTKEQTSRLSILDKKVSGNSALESKVCKEREGRVFSRSASKDNPLERKRYEDGTLERRRYEDDTLERRRYEDGTLERKRYEDGTLERRRYEDGTLERRRYEDGTLERRRYEDGTLERRRYEDGTLERRRYEDGILERKRYEDGTLERRRYEDGTLERRRYEDGTLERRRYEDREWLSRSTPMESTSERRAYWDREGRDKNTLRDSSPEKKSYNERGRYDRSISSGTSTLDRRSVPKESTYEKRSMTLGRHSDLTSLDPKTVKSLERYEKLKQRNRPTTPEPQAPKLSEAKLQLSPERLSRRKSEGMHPIDRRLMLNFAGDEAAVHEGEEVSPTTERKNGDSPLLKTKRSERGKPVDEDSGSSPETRRKAREKHSNNVEERPYRIAETKVGAVERTRTVAKSNEMPEKENLVVKTREDRLKTESDTHPRTRELSPCLKTESDTTPRTQAYLKTESDTSPRTQAYLKTESNTSPRTRELSPCLKTESNTSPRTRQLSPSRSQIEKDKKNPKTRELSPSSLEQLSPTDVVVRHKSFQSEAQKQVIQNRRKTPIITSEAVDAILRGEIFDDEFEEESGVTQRKALETCPEEDEQTSPPTSRKLLQPNIKTSPTLARSSEKKVTISSNPSVVISCSENSSNSLDKKATTVTAERVKGRPKSTSVYSPERELSPDEDFTSPSGSLYHSSGPISRLRVSSMVMSTSTPDLTALAGNSKEPRSSKRVERSNSRRLFSRSRLDSYVTSTSESRSQTMYAMSSSSQSSTRRTLQSRFSSNSILSSLTRFRDKDKDRLSREKDRSSRNKDRSSRHKH